MLSMCVYGFDMMKMMKVSVRVSIYVVINVFLQFILRIYIISFRVARYSRF